MKITTQQTRAVDHLSVNLELIAWAGSGKPEVVARRVANLLTLGGSEPVSVPASVPEGRG